MTYSIKLFCTTLAACLSTSALAQSPCMQYRNIAPLPGGGIAINSEGKTDGQGAAQINIPVAYTPGWGYFSAAVYKGSHDGRQENDNGSGILAAGFGNRPRLYVSGFQVSSIMKESKAVSMQTLLVEEKGNRPAVAIGVQDLLNKEHSTTGRSYYGVVTKSMQLFGRTSFASVGFGDGRFLNKPFGGLSVPVNDLLNGVVEYDSYQINTGITYRPQGRYGNLTVLAAFNGKTGWLFGLGQVFNIKR